MDKFYEAWNRDDQNGVFQEALRELRDVPPEALDVVYRFAVKFEAALLKANEKHTGP